MKKPIALTLTLAALLLVLPLAGRAADGPLSGSYLTSAEYFGPYVVVLQSDQRVGIAVLDQYRYTWYYGFGQLVGNRVTGDFLGPNHSPIGTRFDFTFGDGEFTGWIIYDFGTIEVKGTRLF